MTSKERVKLTIARETPDRVPINYLANPGIDRRLKDHFGLAHTDNDGLRDALGVDFRTTNPPYVGPQLHEPVGDRQVDMWGIHRRWIEHPAGGYWDFCDWPLSDADLETVESWPMPSPDDFDYEAILRDVERYSDYFILTGSPGVGDIINSAGMIRTMEQILVDLMTDEPAGLRYIERKTNIQLEMVQRTLDIADGAIDMLWLGEDLGTQIAPLISLDLYRRRLRPIHQKFVDLGKAFDIPVMIHTCGSSSWAYDDFIEMGVSAVDTLQPEAANMSPAYLKERFGDRLAFHGCISTAGPVTYGTPEETATNVRETLDTMMPGGGYALAPTHQLQDNSPTENVLAVYETARTHGVYS